MEEDKAQPPPQQQQLQEIEPARDNHKRGEDLPEPATGDELAAASAAASAVQDKAQPPPQQQGEIELAGDKRKREEDSPGTATGDELAAAASAGEEAGSGGASQLHPMSKTSLCSYFRRHGAGPDGCRHGEACRYAHTDEELRPRPDGTWDPTSDRAKKLRKVSAEAEEADEEVVTFDDKSLDKCLVGLPRAWVTDRLKTFLQEQGISYATAKKKKGMTVGFVTFETVEELKNAVEVLKENQSGGKEIKIADANRRSHQKSHTGGPVTDNGAATGNNGVAPATADGTPTPEAEAASKKTVRDAVTPLAHMTYNDQLEHKKNSVAQLLKKLTRNAKKACPADVPNPDWVFKSKQIGKPLPLVHCSADMVFSVTQHWPWNTLSCAFCSQVFLVPCKR